MTRPGFAVLAIKCFTLFAAITVASVLSGCVMEVRTLYPVISSDEDEGFPLGSGPLYGFNSEKNRIGLGAYIHEEGFWPYKKYHIELNLSGSIDNSPIYSKEIGESRYIISFQQYRGKYNFFSNLIVLSHDESLSWSTQVRGSKGFSSDTEFRKRGYKIEEKEIDYISQGEVDKFHLSYVPDFEPAMLAADMDRVTLGLMESGRAEWERFLYTRDGLKKHFPRRFDAFRSDLQRLEACMEREDQKMRCAEN